ncbi:Uncharacterised protein [Vibrio cholerae]|uniref:Uncharacterized protein n=1 Tax=Vibrio cholerae TaxID=666 RepID=A0A656AR36_VIBCL|nr:Uncharacterised protein [Vibrio cholerae]CSB95563.1 Uncharacterised protein [Vibrio cholerae]CSB99487.1 Uncharacterised protein [Vibrio cholerae]CSD28248.1 Uncharacterised protein [Vibrio cholerae]CSD48154.1 Uncharacterised protein [Vibrio cholerae]
MQHRQQIRFFHAVWRELYPRECIEIKASLHIADFAAHLSVIERISLLFQSPRLTQIDGFTVLVALLNAFFR